MKLSLCIAGCGGYAKSVLNDIRDMTDILEFSFASRDVEKAKAYCRQYGGVASFGSYEEAASDPAVHAMYFFTPHDRHLEDAKLAAQYGKHVLMEKPIARTVSEAQALIDIVEEAGVKLMIAENFRFDPAVAKAKELIDQGTIGDLRFVDIRSEGNDTSASGWRLNKERTGGGRFIDGGIHDVDVLRNLGGHPDQVFAAYHLPKLVPDIEGEDGITVTARFAGGLTGLIHYSGATPVVHKREEVRVTGTTGQIQFEVFGNQVIVESRTGAQAFPVEPAYRGVRRMLREFRDSIAEDREPVMSGREALNDLAVVVAAYESAETEEAVAVADLL
jgi:predicted dehydrogenase